MFDDIPKALCNVNCVGYVRRFSIFENNVTWLESTIACPLFSGMITSYIEGAQYDRYHLMEEMSLNRVSHTVCEEISTLS